MSSNSLRKKEAFAVVAKPAPSGPPHPAAPALTAAAARVASRAKAAPTGYRRIEVPDWLLMTAASVLGFALFVCAWAAIAKFGGRIPGPTTVWDAAVKIYSDPFYQKGPNDQGIGWNVISSLKRVGIGFGLAALVGIPLGFMLGRFRFLSDMAAPIIAILRPVSPLAWLPIGLLLFKAASPAAIYAIFICSLWPMIINTAVGVRQVPQDYLNVARVLNLSEWKVFTKILFPAVLPYMLTGVRLSIGIAWLVIVAAEMLTGRPGVGGFLYDGYNSGIYANIILSIITIGVVGLILDRLMSVAEANVHRLVG
jgi:nitrate/nitrite transport system permease protein